jgi:hypothetical protein
MESTYQGSISGTPDNTRTTVTFDDKKEEQQPVHIRPDTAGGDSWVDFCTGEVFN